jgi:asparagine synthase (glutamine-hydrolysing)
MTAIAGVWHFDGRPGAAGNCARMLAAQEIYGPHAGAQWREGPVALGRRLFRVVEEDAHDRQPLMGFGGNAVLVADARLDNRDDLIAMLDIAPERARVLCDSAILLAACEHWRDNVVDHLIGDYAFALWDMAQRRLTLARDFLGQRPLYFHRGKNFFAFASMPKGLHAMHNIPRAGDEQRAAEYLLLLPPGGTQTFFKGIERVEPGHIVTVTPDGMTSRCYWQPSRTILKLSSADEYAEAARHHLDQATRARLRGSNGKIAAHLSGGFDSGAVTATAARLLAPSGGQVVAFTAVPPPGYPAMRGERIADEGPLAAATAALYPNIEHVLVRSGERTPLELIDRYFFLFDAPMLNLCNMVWLTAINDAARERKLTVLLNGTLGNFSLTHDGFELLPQLLRQGRLLRLVREISALAANGYGRWRGNLWQSVAPFLPFPIWQRVQTLRGLNLDAGAHSAIQPERALALRPLEPLRQRGVTQMYRQKADSFALRLRVLRDLNFGNFQKGLLAGWGLDQRDPLADRRLVEFCLRVPVEQYLAAGEPRALAKRALADRLPPSVLAQRRRAYQAADWHERLNAGRSEIADEIERLGRCGPAADLLDLPRLNALVADWPSEGRHGRADAPYRQVLLRGISVGHFLRKASGAN